MLDASVLFSPVDQMGGVAKPQTLPSPSAQDVMRFEHILNQGTAGTDAVIPATQQDTQLLQLKPTVEPGTTDFKQAAINTISDIDGSYHRMLDQLSNMPKFNEFMAEKLGSPEKSGMRTYPEVSAERAGDGQKQLQSMVKNSQDYMGATLEYNSMMTRWSMNANMWMGKFSLISSAVNQVAQGFKTLFRTGG